MHLTHSQRIPDLARAPATEYGLWSLDPYRPSDRASRATRRASWRGTGVRAAGVDTAMTRAAAVSASVRQPAWASTGRAPGLVHVHRPTVRPWSSAGLVAPRHVAGSVPTATSGRWVTPTLGTSVTAPRWTAN